MTFGIELSRHGSHLSQRRVQSNFNFEASGDLASRSSCLHLMTQWLIFSNIITVQKTEAAQNEPKALNLVSSGFIFQLHERLSLVLKMVLQSQPPA